VVSELGKPKLSRKSGLMMEAMARETRNVIKAPKREFNGRKENP
jgi:hypothetical protein